MPAPRPAATRTTPPRETKSSPAAAQPQPHRFSVAEYEKMTEVGILREDDRVELLEGEIFEIMAPGNEHIACVNRLARLLFKAVDDDAIVSVQNPIRLKKSEPQPDLALLVPKADFYQSERAGTGDVLLVVEVALSSLEFDRTVKLPIYARERVPEYWIVNFDEKCLEVYAGPSTRGTYSQSRVLKLGEQLNVPGTKDKRISVSEILGVE